MNESDRYVEVEKPMVLDEAFQSEGGEAAQSQAAGLLLLGLAMRNDGEDGVEVNDGAMEAADREYGDPMPAEELGDLGMSLPLGELPRTVTQGPGGLSEELKQAGFSEWSLDVDRIDKTDTETGKVRESQAGLWERLQGDPSARTVAALTWVSCFHRDPLVRVAAATAYPDSISLFSGLPISILESGMADPDPNVAALAEVGLSRFLPTHSALRRRQTRSQEPGQGEPAHTSLMVHGTLARRNSWWQPGGDFHDYVLQNVDTSLYAGGDRFEWSGGYSDAARALGAIDLLGWMKNRSLQGLDLFTHSHGGSAAMLATRGGLDIGRIVLLSCPVHHRYTLNFNRVAKAVSVRVKLDLVILADGGGQRFTDPRILENRLPIWFKHSVTRDPGAWIRHRIPALI